MILKSRHMALRVIPVAVVLLAASAGFATHAAAAGPLFVSPFGDDTNTCQSAADPCATVQAAVAKDTDGSTITLAAGAYVEQVAIDHNVTIVGAGQDESTIQAPAAPLTADAQDTTAIGGTGATYVVAISNSATVTMSKLTVAGPGPATGGCSAGDPNGLDKGITVFGGATLNLSSAAVRNVYNRTNQGCQKGDAISIGSACFSCAADTGHATLTGVKVKIYQKNGIAVRGSGSTLHMTGGSVANNPTTHIASNGIEVVAGAVGVVGGTSVSGNECNLPTACGSDPFNPNLSSGLAPAHSSLTSRLSAMTWGSTPTTASSSPMTAPTQIGTLASSLMPMPPMR
jgi:hypothetical protein